MERRAKIAGTLGPACDDARVLEKMIRAGLDVARLNFSHGSAEDHRQRAKRLRRVAGEVGRTVALMADLQGPRFRVGRVADGVLELEEGSPVEIVAGRTRAPAGKLPVSYPALARDVRRGDTILIDDGKIELRVERVRDRAVHCAVVRGGTVTDRKGINLPGIGLSVPTITAKDRRDLRVAVEAGADWLAISFVRSAGDVRQAKRLLRRAGADLPVMAKIERPEAIDRLEEILTESDGVLVARGDLGVELPAERVPILQKQIIEAALAMGRPVMTATQMLDSMRHSPRPTRAEASDVANAVLDGSDCLLLTAETAAGEYPLESVRMMATIIAEAELSRRTRSVPEPRGAWSIELATTRAGCRAAHDLGASYLVAFTTSGFTAAQAARFRPEIPILAFTPTTEVARRLALLWGVEPRTMRRYQSVESMIAALDRTLLAESLAKRGDVVVVLAGSPVGVTGTTNLIKVQRVGD